MRPPPSSKKDPDPFPSDREVGATRVRAVYPGLAPGGSLLRWPGIGPDPPQLFSPGTGRGAAPPPPLMKRMGMKVVMMVAEVMMMMKLSR